MARTPDTFDERVVVTRTISRGSDDWAVLLAADEEGKTVKLVGRPLGRFAERGRRIRVVGTWKEHPSYGCEVFVTAATPDLQLAAQPAPDVRAVLQRVPHLGAKRAQLLVDHYGEDLVIEKVDANPRHAFMKIAGMPLLHAGEASRWWHEHRRAPAA